METNVSDDDEVGFGKPPKKHQFKTGQSGCPDGGHERRRANKAKRAQKEKEDAKEEDKAIRDIIRKVARERHMIVFQGERVNMSALEITVRNVVLRGMKPDASDRHVSQSLKLFQHAHLLDPVAEGARPMVLVVNQIKSMEEWAKDTEGELLPRNPLHGIPGFENWEGRPTGRRATIPDVTPPDESE
jgi:hypothetical protein